MIDTESGGGLGGWGMGERCLEALEGVKCEHFRRSKTSNSFIYPSIHNYEL